MQTLSQVLSVVFGARVSLTVQSLSAFPTGELSVQSLTTCPVSAQDVSQPFGLTAPANRHCLGTGRVVKCRKGFCLDSDLLAYGLYCLCRLPYTSFLL